jgi:hypothetical protein
MMAIEGAEEFLARGLVPTRQVRTSLNTELASSLFELADSILPGAPEPIDPVQMPVPETRPPSGLAGILTAGAVALDPEFRKQALAQQDERRKERMGVINANAERAQQAEIETRRMAREAKRSRSEFLREMLKLSTQKNEFGESRLSQQIAEGIVDTKSIMESGDAVAIQMIEQDQGMPIASVVTINDNTFQEAQALREADVFSKRALGGKRVAETGRISTLLPAEFDKMSAEAQAEWLRNRKAEIALRYTDGDLGQAAKLQGLLLSNDNLTKRTDAVELTNDLSIAVFDAEVQRITAMADKETAAALIEQINIRAASARAGILETELRYEDMNQLMSIAAQQADIDLTRDTIRHTRFMEWMAMQELDLERDKLAAMNMREERALLMKWTIETTKARQLTPSDQIRVRNELAEVWQKAAQMRLSIGSKRSSMVNNVRGFFGKARKIPDPTSSRTDRKYVELGNAETMLRGYEFDAAAYIRLLGVDSPDVTPEQREFFQEFLNNSFTATGAPPVPGAVAAPDSVAGVGNLPQASEDLREIMEFRTRTEVSQ